MADTGIVGKISCIWRFPVKSMKGNAVDEVEVSGRGLVGDRAFALIDLDTGKVVSAKSIRHFPEILNCSASYVSSPKPGEELPPVRIEFDDGSSVTSDSPAADLKLSAWFKRKVTLAKSAPDDFTIDMFHPDLADITEGRESQGHFADQKLGSAYFAQAGTASPVAQGSFFDLFPVTVLTTSTLNRLNELRPESKFDLRRFRMNLIIDSDTPGFIENDWIGHRLVIGDALELSIVVPDSRCVMTTLAQEDLPRDIEILKTLNQHNKVRIGKAGPFPCAGVYASPLVPGTVRRGDQVRLL